MVPDFHPNNKGILDANCPPRLNPGDTVRTKRPLHYCGETPIPAGGVYTFTRYLYSTYCRIAAPRQFKYAMFLFPDGSERSITLDALYTPRELVAVVHGPAANALHARNKRGA